MPVPKYRTSASRRDKRRSHHALHAKSLSTCANCKEPKMPHRACPSCGHYRGRQVIDPGHMAPGLEASNSVDNSSES